MTLASLPLVEERNLIKSYSYSRRTRPSHVTRFRHRSVDVDDYADFGLDLARHVAVGGRRRSGPLEPLGGNVVGDDWYDRSLCRRGSLPTLASVHGLGVGRLLVVERRIGHGMS